MRTALAWLAPATVAVSAACAVRVVPALRSRRSSGCSGRQLRAGRCVPIHGHPGAAGESDLPEPGRPRDVGSEGPRDCRDERSAHPRGRHPHAGLVRAGCEDRLWLVSRRRQSLSRTWSPEIGGKALRNGVTREAGYIDCSSMVTLYATSHASDTDLVNQTCRSLVPRALSLGEITYPGTATNAAGFRP